MAERVVLVHGLWVGDYCFGPLRRRLRGHGVEAECFGYSATSADLPEHAQRLRDFLAARPDSAVIAHSLGGLVTLAALADQPRRTVLLGAPVRGSFIARRLGRVGLGGIMFRRIADALQSGFVQGLGDHVGVIAGTRRVGLGAMLGGIARPGDGTVTLEETGSDQVTHHLTLPVSHTSMLFSKAVAAQSVAFIRNGRFDPAVVDSTPG